MQTASIRSNQQEKRKCGVSLDQFHHHLESESISQSIGSLINDTISGTAFGKKWKYQRWIHRSYKRSIKIVPDIFQSIQLLHMITMTKLALEKLNHKVDKILDNIINEHRVKKIKPRWWSTVKNLMFHVKVIILVCIRTPIRDVYQFINIDQNNVIWFSLNHPCWYKF